jgi:hypothetical protein
VDGDGSSGGETVSGDPIGDQLPGFRGGKPARVCRMGSTRSRVATPGEDHPRSARPIFDILASGLADPPQLRWVLGRAACSKPSRVETCRRRGPRHCALRCSFQTGVDRAWGCPNRAPHVVPEPRGSHGCGPGVVVEQIQMLSTAHCVGAKSGSDAKRSRSLRATDDRGGGDGSDRQHQTTIS